ncbi:MAG: hypothetical protein U0744_20615 [Gemmataceae bacterium]
MQAVGDNVMFTRGAAKPRLLEVDRKRKIVVEVALQAQTKDHHLQTRMARKLDNGNYLVPQLLDRVVREYTPQGKIVWEAKTPHMPFTAIRLPDGNTLVGCTLGHLVVEFDTKAKLVWQVRNTTLGSTDQRCLRGAASPQREYRHHQPSCSRILSASTEVNRDKKVVWLHRDATKPGILAPPISKSLTPTAPFFEGRPPR